MKNRLVVVPSVNDPIKESPGFAKKSLSAYKLDIMALCGFGCRYCSSNSGYYLRRRREPFADLTEAQLGERLYPAQEPSLSFVWPDVLEKLEAQLSRKRRTWGEGMTLVFSMLTDGFSPTLVADGTTRRALEMVLSRTSFRIRVLTKNAIVGSREWIDFFSLHRDRFVVGLSTGSLDEEWARKIEVGTSLPSARLRALRALQDAGVPTFGMMCPIFPDVLASGRLDELIDAIRPERCETVWAEPFNDRDNWRAVRAGYAPGSPGWKWFDRTYEAREHGVWSRYAADLYTALRVRAQRDGWISKLNYLLYENEVTATDAPAFRGLVGVSLQSKPGPDGLSTNPHIAAVQQMPPLALTRFDHMDIEPEVVPQAKAMPLARCAASLDEVDLLREVWANEAAS